MNNIKHHEEMLKWFEIVNPLIKLLAQNRSQEDIAEILNNAGIYKFDGKRWAQYSVSRYMKNNGIKSAYLWKGWRAGQADNRYSQGVIGE